MARQEYDAVRIPSPSPSDVVKRFQADFREVVAMWGESSCSEHRLNWGGLKIPNIPGDATRKSLWCSIYR